MKQLLLIFLSFQLTFCSSKTEFINTGTPETASLDSEKINQLISDIESGKINNIHGLLIIKDDQLITEEYFEGYHRNRLHYSASVSKSFASTLLGIAIDKGYFEDDIQTVLNKNVAELFPEFESVIQKDYLKEELTLSHILSMTAGFQWDEHTYPYSDNRNDCNRINNSDNPMNFLLERKLIQSPGAEFYYNGGLSLSISYLIEKYTNMSVDDFAEEFLFEPLEIDKYEWESVAGGLIDTDGGLHLKPIDQAKLGYLFLNHGIWKGQQVVSEEWVEESTKMRVINANMPDYGYQWWGGDLMVFDQSYFMYFASGHGGQKIVVIPAFNTVIVLTQQVFDNPFGDFNFIAIMTEYIMPALTGNSPTFDTINIPEEKLKNFEGYFVTDYNEYIDFSSSGQALIGESNNGQINRFIPISENTFKTRVMDLVDIYIRFEEDSARNIVSARSNFGFSKKHFRKR